MTMVQTPVAAPLPICAAIVSYNRRADLRRCLASLARLRPGVAEVVVVDNGSTDGTPEMLRAEFGWVRLVEAGRNLGACLARNLAAELSAQPFLWFLDSDTEAGDPAAAARLHALFLANPELAAAGGEALLDAEGRSIGVKRLRCGKGGIVQGDRLVTAAPESAACEVIASCNLMLRRGDFLAAGGFDPFYFFFYEDMDLTWRLHAAGRHLAVLSPMPVLHHFSESSRVRGLWRHARNRMYFCLKNLPARQLALLPLHDAGFVCQLDNLRRLLARARQPAAAVSAVAGPVAGAGAGAGAPRGAVLSRAAGLVGRMAALVLLGYLALPVVLGPALAARRRERPGAAPRAAVAQA